MRNFFWALFASAACLILASCSSVTIQEDLTSRFFELQDAGKIPGTSPGAHGNLQTAGVRWGDHITYPFSQQVYLTQDNDPAHYTYNFIKDTRTSRWRLTGAWRMLPDGRKVDLMAE